jgi:hypothetical protein
MKPTRIVLSFVLVPVVALAQTTSAPAPRRVSAAGAQVAAKKAATPATRKTSKPKPETAGAEGDTAPAAAAASFRRDPFLSVIQTRALGAPNCGSGKKCLVINQIVLKGIVKGRGVMLALVENDQHKSYFLRESDPVFNGQVIRITGDSIVFREKAIDRLGRVVTHDVVKSIAPAKPA